MLSGGKRHTKGPVIQSHWYELSRIVKAIKNKRQIGSSQKLGEKYWRGVTSKRCRLFFGVMKMCGIRQRLQNTINVLRASKLSTFKGFVLYFMWKFILPSRIFFILSCTRNQSQGLMHAKHWATHTWPSIFVSGGGLLESPTNMKLIHLIDNLSVLNAQQRFLRFKIASNDRMSYHY